MQIHLILIKISFLINFLLGFKFIVISIVLRFHVQRLRSYFIYDDDNDAQYTILSPTRCI